MGLPPEIPEASEVFSKDTVATIKTLSLFFERLDASISNTNSGLASIQDMLKEILNTEKDILDACKVIIEIMKGG